jgi:hypothetical protein
MSTDVELLQITWDQQTEPLSRDVVITVDVTEYVRRHCVSKPSVDRVGKMLSKEPFHGITLQFQIGPAKYRGMALRHKQRWAGAPDGDVMAHISDGNISVDTSK